MLHMVVAKSHVFPFFSACCSLSCSSRVLPRWSFAWGASLDCSIFFLPVFGYIFVAATVVVGGWVFVHNALVTWTVKWIFFFCDHEAAMSENSEAQEDQQQNRRRIVATTWRLRDRDGSSAAAAAAAWCSSSSPMLSFSWTHVRIAALSLLHLW